MRSYEVRLDLGPAAQERCQPPERGLEVPDSALLRKPPLPVQAVRQIHPYIIYIEI